MLTNNAVYGQGDKPCINAEMVIRERNKFADVIDECGACSSRKHGKCRGLVDNKCGMVRNPYTMEVLSNAPHKPP